MRGQVLSLLLILALLSLSAPAGASVIYVSGDQTGTWSADTVIVTAEVRVPPGQSLTIQPGVEVLFSVYCKLIVDNGAALWAVGTRTDSIRFDALLPDSSWHGIRFRSASDSSRLEYCHLTHGLATGSGGDENGGAIYCSNSSPTISSNTISGNSATSSGGGICCSYSRSSIVGNTISENWAGEGGGISCVTSSPIIRNNSISRNSAPAAGGIMCQTDSNPLINGNIINENSATYYDGGGIYCLNNSNASICDNYITGNTANSWWGGGIICYYSSPSISGNVFMGNSASDGGGIFLDHSSSRVIGNTLSGNTAAYRGGGICLFQSCLGDITGNTFSGNSGVGSGIYYWGSANAGIVNCILWGDSGQEISWYIGPPTISYSDVQGFGNWGTNIDSDPLFVNAAQQDYRLQWGSPCIDSGDPNPIYNDPDGTRADMGAWYYDQSLPVRVLLTPYNQPIQIPPEGGSFQYAIQATNIESDTLSALIWCNVTLPSGTIYGPVLGPVAISLGAGQTLSRVRTQNISAHAPAGMYHYNAYAVAAGDTSEDNFVFTKLGAGGLGLGAGDWTNTGEAFGEEIVMAEGLFPSSFFLFPSHPNPFNPTTAISYELQASSYARLKVYDTAGRLVASLVDGWRQAGSHKITFDGSGLPSGVYLYRLQAGGSTANGKMVLMK